MKLKFVRSTILKSYLRCPYRFKLEWINGLKGHFPEAVHRGNRLHKALELYIKEGREQAVKCLADDDEDRELFNKIDEIMRILPEGGEILSEYSFREHFEGLPEMRGTMDIVMIDKEQVRSPGDGGWCNLLRKPDTDVYAYVVQQGSDFDGWLQTFTIDSSGNISTLKDEYEFDTSNAYFPTLFYRGDNIFVVLWGRFPGTQGNMATFSIDGSGNISLIDTWTFDETCISMAIDGVHCEGDLCAVCYQGGDGCKVFTFNVDSSGNITKSMIDTATFFGHIDSVNHIEFFHHIDNKYFAVFQATRGYIQTLSIELPTAKGSSSALQIFAKMLTG